MDLLWPGSRTDVDPDDLYGAPERPAPPDRPWVIGVMVQSADGAAVIDGVSAGLGGDTDSRVFAALRRVPDAVVVAAGTARAEDYGPPAASERSTAVRTARGLTATPLLVVVTRSLALDPASRLFAGGHRPLVVTTTDADPDRRRSLADVADVVTVGDGAVDPRALLTMLRERGIEVVVLEGGPSFNAGFVEADLVDEWCLTIDPVVVGGNAPRIVRGDTPTPRGFDLAHVALGDGALFVRLVRSAGD